MSAVNTTGPSSPEGLSDFALAGVPVVMAPVVLGTMTFGDSVDETVAAQMIDTALESGVTGIDTANGYAGGRSEKMLGALLATRRDDVVLASKAGIAHPDAGGFSPLSPTGLRLSVEGSLTRLGTDRLDVLYLHQPDRATTVDDTVATLGELLASGTILSWGVSNHAAWQVADLQRAAADAGVAGPVISQQVYSPVAARLDDEYSEFARVHGVPTLIYNPLAGGLLTGKHRRDEEPGTGRYGSSPLARMYRDRYWNDEVFDAVDRLGALADEAGLGLVELTLRWAAGRPAVNGVLLGGSRVANIRANLEALAHGPLDAALHDRVTAVSDSLRGSMPAYNR